MKINKERSAFVSELCDAIRKLEGKRITAKSILLIKEKINEYLDTVEVQEQRVLGQDMRSEDGKEEADGLVDAGLARAKVGYYELKTSGDE